MYLETLRLLNFKNYKTIDYSFDKEINCLVGENGVGKTNVLDAVYYLSLAKSSFNISDHQLIRHGEQFFSLRGNFRKNSHSFEIKCTSRPNNKKSVSINDKEYETIREHIGSFPVVLISPNDTEIIRGSSENRRKFVDGVISQLDKEYLENLLRYNHALKQRNSLLKTSEGFAYLDMDLIESFDRIISHSGKEIHSARRKFISRYVPVLKDLYADISDQKEDINIEYQSDIENNDFFQLLKDSLERDVILKRTTRGIHRDDYNIFIDGYPMKRFASQGQQKSLIVSLKIAQFQIMREVCGFKPILLMDDVFDKLDDKRIEKLMKLVAGHTFGQIFVTDARPERTLSIFESIQSGIRIFHIHDGKADLLVS